VTAHTIIQPQPASDPRYADVQARWAALAKFCAGMAGQPARIHLDPMPSDYRAFADDLRLLAANLDPLVEAMGEYFAANVPGYVDLSLFKNQLRDALEGNAIYEIESAAEVLAEDLAEAMS